MSSVCFSVSHSVQAEGCSWVMRPSVRLIQEYTVILLLGGGMYVSELARHNKYP